MIASVFRQIQRTEWSAVVYRGSVPGLKTRSFNICKELIRKMNNVVGLPQLATTRRRSAVLYGVNSTAWNLLPGVHVVNRA